MAVETIQPVALSVSFPWKGPSDRGVNQFDELVLALKRALGPSSGLTSDDVDVAELTRLMEEYMTNESDWSRYAMGDESRGYTRNLVDEGNGKSNLVRLTTVATRVAVPESVPK